MYSNGYPGRGVIVFEEIKGAVEQMVDRNRRETSEFKCKGCGFAFEFMHQNLAGFCLECFRRERTACVLVGGCD